MQISNNLLYKTGITGGNATNKDKRKQLNEISERIKALLLEISILKSEEEMSHDNLPEGIQDSPIGERLEDSANYLDSACGWLDSAIDEINMAISC